MAKVILVTVGTSVLEKAFDEDNGGFNNLDDLIKELENEPRNNENRIYETWKTNAFNRMKAKLEIFYNNNGEGVERLSAELASLLIMHGDQEIGNITQEDKIFLLHSDSIAGKLCAEVNKEIISMNINDQSLCPYVNIIKLDGVKVVTYEDEDILGLFIDQGLQSFQDNVENIINEHGNNNKIYMNITGGYKILVPFSTILAHNLRMNIVYLYEKSDRLIKLPSAYLACKIENPKSKLNEGISEAIPNNQI